MATSAAMVSAPMGPAPNTMAVSPLTMPERVIAVQRDGQGLGQRRHAAATSRRGAAAATGRR